MRALSASSPLSALNRGPLAYVLLTAYLLLTSALLLTNTRTSLSTDILFILFLLGFLLIYRAKVAGLYKLALGAVMLLVVVPYFGAQNAYYIELAIKPASSSPWRWG